MEATEQSIADDLAALGVESGDVLFTHASYKSLGPVAGGAESVIRAMERTVGRDGTLLMPSFTLSSRDRDERARLWDRENSASTVGWLTECFRALPGTVRSDHYSHSVCARGNRAEYFVSGHTDRVGPVSPWDREPWGRTYGDNSPMVRAYREATGKVLMLGVDYDSATYCHLVEVLYWNRRLVFDSRAEYLWSDREAVGAEWDRSGWLSRGRIAQADCRLFGIAAFVDTVLEWVETDPSPFLR